jgi:hypothetical protein
MQTPIFERGGEEAPPISSSIGRRLGELRRAASVGREPASLLVLPAVLQLMGVLAGTAAEPQVNPPPPVPEVAELDPKAELSSTLSASLHDMPRDVMQPET